MITVPTVTEKIIKRSRYLSEALSKGLINHTALARYIHKEVEEITFKQVTAASIVMAIKRLDKKIKPGYKTFTIFQDAPDMIVRSNLSLIYLANSENLLEKFARLEKEGNSAQKRILFSYGRAESFVIYNKLNEESVIKILKEEKITRKFTHVSAITIHLPKGATETPGVFYFLIKSLSWEGVNILDILSTENELVLLFKSHDVNQAFGILNSIFEKGE